MRDAYPLLIKHSVSEAVEIPPKIIGIFSAFIAVVCISRHLLLWVVTA